MVCEGNGISGRANRLAVDFEDHIAHGGCQHLPPAKWLEPLRDGKGGMTSLPRAPERFTRGSSTRSIGISSSDPVRLSRCIAPTSWQGAAQPRRLLAVSVFHIMRVLVPNPTVDACAYGRGGRRLFVLGSRVAYAGGYALPGRRTSNTCIRHLPHLSRTHHCAAPLGTPPLTIKGWPYECFRDSAAHPRSH